MYIDLDLGLRRAKDIAVNIFLVILLIEVLSKYIIH